MGAEPFLLASSINAVVGQRVVRKLCPHCRAEFVPPEEVAENIKATLGKLLPLAAQQSLKAYKPVGCPQCNQVGSMGRIGIFEVLAITEKIARQILERASTSEIEETAVADGMVTMKQDGDLKVLAGVTSMEEVLRVAQD